MKLVIHDNLFIYDVQEHFSKCFANLKIEFYNEPHHWKEGSSDRNLLNPQTRLGDIRTKHVHGVMDIMSWNRVGEIEQSFKKIYGLNVQVFRKQNDFWIQTRNSDECTLKELSEIGNKSLHA